MFLSHLKIEIDIFGIMSMIFVDVAERESNRIQFGGSTALEASSEFFYRMDGKRRLAMQLVSRWLHTE